MSKKISVFVGLLGLFALVGCATEPPEETVPSYEGTQIRTSDPRPPKEEQQGFHLPPGFDIELFAAEPDIGKPFNIVFDAQGRLWVTQSCSYPFPTGKACDRITILEDTDGDGQADTFTEFADSLNIPIGVLPLPDGGAIAYSIPNIYRFYDDDGDGRADRRKVLYGPFDHEDTHGMVNHLRRGYDGWIYACHGYSNRSVIAGTDGHTITMLSGNTFRFRPDGSRVELVTTGRVNPSGLAMSTLGYHFSTDSHSDPIYQLIPGGDYPNFSKKPTGIGFAPPMMDHGHPPTARAGLALYDAKQFPPAYRQNFFQGNVRSSRIMRDSLAWHGATPEAVHRSDFLTSEDPWFRPVDMVVGPDGALYVADFYNRIIGHYEVPLGHPGRDHHRGRIWRITYQGEEVDSENPVVDWTGASLEALVAGLGAATVDTRLRVADQLVLRVGAPAAEPVEAMVRDDEASPIQRVHGLWVLYRLDALPEDLLTAAVQDPAPLVRVHALRILAERSELDDRQHAFLRAALSDESAHVQRAAVQALAQHPRLASLEPLLALQHRIPAYDTHLRYTTRLSLRNHLRQESIMQAVMDEHWNEADARALADVMPGVYTEEAAAFLFDHVQRFRPPEDHVEDYVAHAIRYLPSRKRDALVAYLREEYASDVGLQMRLFSTVQASAAQRGVPLRAATEAWGTTLATRVLGDVPSSSTEIHASLEDSAASPPGLDEAAGRRRLAAEIAGTFRVTRLGAPLQRLLEAKRAHPATRVAAAHALMQLNPSEHAPRIEQIIRDKADSLIFRQDLVRAMGQSTSPQATAVLVSTLREAPYRLQVSAAKALAGTTEGAERVLQAVRDGAVPPLLLTEGTVKERLFSSASDTSAMRRAYEALTQDLRPVDEQTQRLIEKRLASFSPARASAEAGRSVFATYCATCHQVAGRGGEIGPELDGVGSRSAYELTEQILAPSRVVPQAFRMSTITLKNGDTRFGLFRRQEGEVLVFANVQGEEFSIPASEITKRTDAPYSLMPDTFGETLSPDAFHDLLAYLLSLK